MNLSIKELERCVVTLPIEADRPYKSGNCRDSQTVTEVKIWSSKCLNWKRKSGPMRVQFTAHQQTSLWGRSETRSTLHLRSRRLLMPTGTREWWRSGTLRCRWMNTHNCLDWWLCHFSLYLIVIIAPNTHLSWIPCIFNKYAFVSLRSIETSLDELRASFHTTPKRSMLATWTVVSPPRSRVKNQRTS